MRLIARNAARIVLTMMTSLTLCPASAAEQDHPGLTPRLEGSNQWFNLRQLDVEGRGWNDTKAFYDRLPARAEGKVPAKVWELSRNSAGMCVRFVTDATTLRARWALTESWLHLPNMTAIGKSALLRRTRQMPRNNKQKHESL